MEAIELDKVEKVKITVETVINAPVEKVWNFWTEPKHIVNWNNASDDWYTPKAENDLRVGGKLIARMEARDGSFGFDFTGVYNKVEPYKEIEYTLDDGRKVKVSFGLRANETTVTETFEAEQTHSLELQQEGWQAILDNFKRYVEVSNRLEKLHFEITIDAPAEKVYKYMLYERYSEWTSEFNPTSRFEGSWEKGAKIVFLGEEANSTTAGMVSRIRENIPNRFLSIEHLGIIQGDKEITSGPEIEDWAGALENYSFKEENGKTLVTVDVDTNQEFKSYMIETWPKALKKLKAICEV